MLFHYNLLLYKAYNLLCYGTKNEINSLILLNQKVKYKLPNTLSSPQVGEDFNLKI